MLINQIFATQFIEKQEFGPASLYVENFKCEDSNEVYVQKGSLFKKLEE